MTIPPVPVIPPADVAAYSGSALSAFGQAWLSRDAAQQAYIAELEAQQDVVTTGPAFGVNAPPALEADYRERMKPIEVLRYYFQPGELPVYPLPGGAWPLGPGQFLCLSMKKINLTVSEIVTFFRQIPTDRKTYVSGWHEPKSELAAKTFTKAQYDALYVRMRQAQQQVGGHIQIIPILEGIAFLAGNDPDDELPADPSTYDVVGVDPYFAGTIGQPYANMNAVLDTYKKKADSLGKPWAVCETGIGTKYITGQARNDALTALAQAFIARDPLFVAYFLGDKPDTIQWSLKASDGSRDAWLRGAGRIA